MQRCRSLHSHTDWKSNKFTTKVLSSAQRFWTSLMTTSVPSSCKVSATLHLSVCRSDTQLLHPYHTLLSTVSRTCWLSLLLLQKKHQLQRRKLKKNQKRNLMTIWVSVFSTKYRAKEPHRTLAFGPYPHLIMSLSSLRPTPPY